MRYAAVAVLALVAAGPFVAAGAEASFHERFVTRAYAAPGPVLVLDAFPDKVVYRVEIDRPETVVQVVASSNDTAPFYLQWRPWTASGTPQSPLPASRHAPLLSGPGEWRLEVDPAFGVNVHIHLTFRGHVGDERGDASPFRVVDHAEYRPCRMEACLP